MSTKKKKRNQAEYESNLPPVVTAIGILLIALGLLGLLSLLNVVKVQTLNRFFLGLGGVMCYGVAVLLLWLGVLMTLSSRGVGGKRLLFLVTVIYLCVLAIVNLWSGNESSHLLDIVLNENKNLNAVPNPDSFWSMLKATYSKCARQANYGGALGMIFAWPAWKLLKTPIMGTVVLVLVIVACVLFIAHFDVKGAIDRARENAEAMEKAHEQKRAREEYRRQVEEQERLRQENERKLRTPAYQRRNEAMQAYQGGGLPQVSVPQQYCRQAELYDEIVAPQSMQGFWQTPFPQQSVQEAQQTEPETNAVTEPAPKNAAQRKAFEKLQEIRRRKAEIDEMLQGNEQARMASVKEDFAPAIQASGDGMIQQQAMAFVEETQPIPAVQNAWYPEENPVQTEAWQPYPANFKPLCEGSMMQGEPLTERPVENPPVEDTMFQPPVFVPARKETEGTMGQNEAVTPFASEQGDPTVDYVLPRRKTDYVKPQEATVLPEKKFSEPAANEVPPYVFPSVGLLRKPENKPAVDTRGMDQERAAQLERTLESFNIPATVQRVTHGPAVTRFELGLNSSGINVRRIQSISDNIALDLAAKGGVRIEIPIPGTNLFGVEVPNKEIASVSLSEVLMSEEMRKNPSPLAVALGKDIAGRPVICNLAKMPHLLIAGQTGSGKSVCINTIINSLLYRATPEEVRMIMIDPKVVELQCYNEIPHLLIPVVSDPTKAAGALAWAVAEMMDRYHKMQRRNVREISAYNEKLEPGEEKIPRIVIIIDELADLMLACKKEVEDSIIRIAQLARAAGIHMIVATQRPTVDVITGLIKANIPSRIAFAVSSSIDSRTILDQNGAEKLLGRGDMFYFPTGDSSPTRVQGCFMSDSEIEGVVASIVANRKATYDPDVLDALDGSDGAPGGLEADENPDGADPRLAEAIELVITSEQASISMLQRRMKIGHSRAGRLIDDMALRGIVSHAAGSKAREVLMTREQYEQIKDTLS